MTDYTLGIDNSPNSIYNCKKIRNSYEIMPTMIPIDQIVVPTSRWQVTIPKKVREELDLEEKTPLNVTSDNGKIVMQPFKKVIKEEVWTEERRRKLYQAVKKIQGLWADDWPEIKKRLEKQRKIELAASKRRRKGW